MPTTVAFTVSIYNRQKDDIPDGAVYVGRPTQFGNPWRVGRDGTREEVVQKYRDFLQSNETLQQLARDKLKGKDLVCWCAPEPCHAEVLAEVANR